MYCVHQTQKVFQDVGMTIECVVHYNLHFAQPHFYNASQCPGAA